MEETFFYVKLKDGNKIYNWEKIVAALAAAGINITNVSLAMSDGEYNGWSKGYVVCYKFQWRSHGNYIWSDSVAYGERNLSEILYEIYTTVKRLRGQLEEPAVRGKYRYLEEE